MRDLSQPDDVADGPGAQVNAIRIFLSTGSFTSSAIKLCSSAAGSPARRRVDQDDELGVASQSQRGEGLATGKRRQLYPDRTAARGYDYVVLGDGVQRIM